MLNEKFLKNSNTETTAIKSNLIEKYILKGKIHEMRQKIMMIKRLNKLPIMVKKMNLIKNKFETFNKYLKIKNMQIIDNLIVKKHKIQRRKKKRLKYKKILEKVNNTKFKTLKKKLQVFDFEKRFEGKNKKNFFLFKKKVDSEFFK